MSSFYLDPLKEKRVHQRDLVKKKNSRAKKLIIVKSEKHKAFRKTWKNSIFACGRFGVFPQLKADLSGSEVCCCLAWDSTNFLQAVILGIMAKPKIIENNGYILNIKQGMNLN